MKRRAEALETIADGAFEVCVIGGGATGAGCALDAQLRGMKTALLDAGDFAGATSSASTKLVHGGVRYLEQAIRELDPAEYRVVRRALRERTRMLKNGPYLSRELQFLAPCYRWFDAAYFGAGLKLYDWIAGKAGLSPSHFLSKKETLRRMPDLKPDRLTGSVAYADGQFDDARYNLALVESFVKAGGEALNYARVTRFEKDAHGKLIAAQVEDVHTNQDFTLRVKVFVNATGPFSDTVRALAAPGAAPRMRLSKGVHIVLPREVMGSEDALLIPKTEDGRVLFAIPWMGRLLVGTTEQEASIVDDLHVTKDDVEYLLRHLNSFLARPVTPDQVVSGFAGLRPLVSSGKSRDTKKLARDHEIEFDARSGLISILGGKWTTYRAMAEDTIDAVQKYLGKAVTPSPTRDHALAGSEGYTADFWRMLADERGVAPETARHLAEKYGTASLGIADLMQEDSKLAVPILNGLAPVRAEIVWATRREMAMTIEDVLARRIGLQFFSWQSAADAAPAVASILARALGWDTAAENEAVAEYTGKINRWMAQAGLAPKPGITPTN